MKLALVADIHEDINNLNLALQKAEKLNCNELVCLGDIVGYSVPYYKYLEERDANACIEVLQKNAKYVVAGNHDHFAVRKLPKVHPCNDIPENWYDLSIEIRKEISTNRIWLYEDSELSAMLNSKSYEWLSCLPESVVCEFGSKRILFTHFLFPDITGFTRENYNIFEKINNYKSFLMEADSNFNFFGHLHPSQILVIKKDGSYNFNIHQKANSETIAFGIPAIARNDCFSGFVIYDTETQVLDLYKL